MSRLLQFNWLGVVDYIPALLQGLYYTLLISVVGLIIGFILGAIFGLGRISRSKILYGISAVYVEVLRGTPDRESTRLNSSDVATSYAGFCLKTKLSL